MDRQHVEQLVEQAIKTGKPSVLLIRRDGSVQVIDAPPDVVADAFRRYDPVEGLKRALVHIDSMDKDLG